MSTLHDHTALVSFILVSSWQIFIAADMSVMWFLVSHDKYLPAKRLVPLPGWHEFVAWKEYFTRWWGKRLCPDFYFFFTFHFKPASQCVLVQPDLIVEFLNIMSLLKSQGFLKVTSLWGVTQQADAVLQYRPFLLVCLLKIPFLTWSVRFNMV